MTLPTLATVAGMIDHAILKPELTRSEVDAELHLAHEYKIFSVCVRPSDVAFAVDRLASLNSSVAVGTVIGFPHGTTSTAAKVAEIRQALADGATEFDVVLNIGLLKSGMLSEVTRDLQAVVDAAEGHLVKAIFETALLTESEKLAACEAAVEADLDFVKTSTGFASGGATREDLILMRENTPAPMQVKASGGVRSLDTLLEFLDLGATRFGTSATATILDDLKERLAGGRGTHAVDTTSY